MKRGHPSLFPAARRAGKPHQNSIKNIYIVINTKCGPHSPIKNKITHHSVREKRNKLYCTVRMLVILTVFFICNKACKLPKSLHAIAIFTIHMHYTM